MKERISPNRVVLSGLFILILFSTSMARATLIDRGSGLIYDVDRDLTWYDFTYKGPMDSGASWLEATTWAAGLNVGGVNGWRLPSALGPEGGASLGIEAASEMGHLWRYELGNDALPPIQEPLTTGPFTELVVYKPYWTNTPYGENQSHYYDFTWFGNQNADFQDLANAQQVFPHLTAATWSNGEFAMAVHDGDIASIPEPTTALLVGLGLVGMAARKRV